MKYFLLLYLLIFLQNVSLFANEVFKKIEVTVAASSVNVRTKASTKSDIVCQLSKGRKVTVVDVQNGWAKIIAPANAAVWIDTSNLDNAVVKESGARVYSGPATAYSVLGSLPAATKVTIVLGSEKWARIKPLDGIFLWVSAKFLEFPEIEVIRKQSNNAKELLIGQEYVLEKDDSATADKKDLGLIGKDVIAKFNPGDEEFYFQQKLVSLRGLQLLTGVVSELEAPVENLATHALGIRVDAKYYTVCYLRSGNFDLNSWLGKNVAIEGPAEQVASWQRPIIVVNKIREIANEPTLKIIRPKEILSNEEKN